MPRRRRQTGIIERREALFKGIGHELTTRKNANHWPLTSIPGTTRATPAGDEVLTESRKAAVKLAVAWENLAKVFDDLSAADDVEVAFKSVREQLANANVEFMRARLARGRADRQAAAAAAAGTAGEP